MNRPKEPDNLVTLFCKLQRAAVVMELLVVSGQLDVALSTLNAIRDFVTQIENYPTIKEYINAKEEESKRNHLDAQGQGDTRIGTEGQPGDAPKRRRRSNSGKE